jgi:hypothetical protein
MDGFIATSTSIVHVFMAVQDRSIRSLEFHVRFMIFPVSKR